MWSAARSCLFRLTRIIHRAATSSISIHFPQRPDAASGTHGARSFGGAQFPAARGLRLRSAGTKIGLVSTFSELITLRAGDRDIGRAAQSCDGQPGTGSLRKCWPKLHLCSSGARRLARKYSACPGAVCRHPASSAPAGRGTRPGQGPGVAGVAGIGGRAAREGDGGAAPTFLARAARSGSGAAPRNRLAALPARVSANSIARASVPRPHHSVGCWQHRMGAGA